MEKWEKTHILGIFESCVPVHPVQLFLFRSVFCILAITRSFLIRFELFKWKFKIDFKANHPYINRHRQILALSGSKIHSKWGHVQAKF